MSEAAPLRGVAVIVVNYGSSELLRANLVPLTRAEPDLLAVIVDNFTDADEQHRVEELARTEGWHTVLCADNKGFGEGMNLGVDRAKSVGATQYLLLNPDASITGDALRALRGASMDDPMAMIAPRILRPDGSVWSEVIDLYLADGRVRSTRRRQPGAEVQEWLSGACLLLSDQLWNAVGGFDLRYFLYWEDVDLSWKVVHAGGTLRLIDDVVATHAEGGSQGAGHDQAGLTKSATYYYFNVRNRILFSRLRLDATHQRAWRRQTLRVSYEIALQGRGKRQLWQLRRVVLPALRGIRDGVRMSGSMPPA